MDRRATAGHNGPSANFSPFRSVKSRMAIRIAINGAAGRMGQRLIALASADPQLQVVAAIEHAAPCPAWATTRARLAGVGPLGIPLSAALEQDVDVAIDFSVPQATSAILAQCLAKKIPLVVATTGLADEQKQQIRDAARQIPVLWSPSMSLAVNLTMKLAEIAARRLADHPVGRRRRNHRAAPSLQGRRSQRHGPAASARSSPA